YLIFGNATTMRRTSRFSPQRSRPGFTLVELLVVIGIIALLIAILLPALGRARAQAQSVACLANLRSIGQAIGIYAVQNKQSMPSGSWFGGPLSTDPNARLPNYSDPNEPFSDWALLLMSNALGKGGTTVGSNVGTDNRRLEQMFSCPSAKDIQSKVIRR